MQDHVMVCILVSVMFHLSMNDSFTNTFSEYY